MLDDEALDLNDTDGNPVSLATYAGAPLVIQLARFYG